MFLGFQDADSSRRQGGGFGSGVTKLPGRAPASTKRASESSGFSDGLGLICEASRRGETVVLRNRRGKGAIKSRDQVGEPIFDIGLGDLLCSKQRTILDVNDTFLDAQQLIKPGEEIRK